jgi:hypothetical protein
LPGHPLHGVIVASLAVVLAADLAAGPPRRAHAQDRPANVVAADKTLPQPLLLGSAWYPEQWPEARWETDLTLMQQAHLHVVRVGEFAWSTLEPSEDVYDLDWLERAINLAGKHGIFTVLGTPTATPPAWLTSRYPETLRIDENGRRGAWQSAAI